MIEQERHEQEGGWWAADGRNGPDGGQGVATRLIGGGLCTCMYLVATRYTITSRDPQVTPHFGRISSSGGVERGYLL